MDLGLNNKVALVTAASQGLGKASAISLANEGVKLIICSRDKAKITKAEKDIKELNYNQNQNKLMKWLDNIDKYNYFEKKATWVII